MERKDKVEGEGSYSGTKDYNERTERFVEQGKVDEAARKAKPRTKEQEEEMKRAEEEGKRHIKR